MTTPTLPAGKTAVQLVEEGKRRLDALTTRVTRAKTILETTSAQLDTAKAEAGVEYGVMTLPELNELLTTRHAENATKALEFVAALDVAEGQVKAIETHLAA